MQQYSIEQLTKMIFANNMTAIHAALVSQTLLTSYASPSVEAAQRIIERKSVELSSGDFMNWFEHLLDVPVDANGPYAVELNGIKMSQSLAPSKLLVDMMRAEQSQFGSNFLPGSVNSLFQPRPWWVWAVLFLAFIGLVCTFKFFAKVAAKIAA